MKRLTELILKKIGMGLILLSIGCGYTLQNSHNPLGDKEGVQKIYIQPFVNNTYKVGVENLVYNSMIRSLAAHGRVTLVQNPEDADAILQGTVSTAYYVGSAGNVVSSLNPKSIGSKLPTSGFVVATEYTANLACGFTLIRRNPPPKKKGTIWSASFARAKAFPSSNQLDVPGTTSALINDSEFDRALADLARSMMDDAHESMLAMF